MKNIFFLILLFVFQKSAISLESASLSENKSEAETAETSENPLTLQKPTTSLENKSELELWQQQLLQLFPGSAQGPTFGPMQGKNIDNIPAGTTALSLAGESNSGEKAEELKSLIEKAGGPYPALIALIQNSKLENKSERYIFLLIIQFIFKSLIESKKDFSEEEIEEINSSLLRKTMPIELAVVLGKSNQTENLKLLKGLLGLFKNQKTVKDKQEALNNLSIYFPKE